MSLTYPPWSEAPQNDFKLAVIASRFSAHCSLIMSVCRRWHYLSVIVLSHNTIIGFFAVLWLFIFFLHFPLHTFHGNCVSNIFQTILESEQCHSSHCLTIKSLLFSCLFFSNGGFFANSTLIRHNLESQAMEMHVCVCIKL